MKKKDTEIARLKRRLLQTSKENADLVLENDGIKKATQELIDHTYIWTGRPTKDGAKILRSLASKIEEEINGKV